MSLAAKTDGRPGPRIGRPPNEFAGEVEARILDAAARVFLQRGFDGASIGEIAEVARAGKPTIYARYATKEALFEAAFLRKLAARNARLETHHAEGATVEERLTSIGVALLEETLTEDFVGLMRLAVAEARRLPDMGLVRQCRERGGRLVMRGCSPTASASRCGRTARSPRRQGGAHLRREHAAALAMRALAQEDLAALRAEIPGHVRERAKFFLAALRGGGLDKATA